jgi:hypothetical protein
VVRVGAIDAVTRSAFWETPQEKTLIVDVKRTQHLSS